MFQSFRNSVDTPEVSTSSTLLIFRKETRYSIVRWFRVHARLPMDNLQNEEASSSEMSMGGRREGMKPKPDSTAHTCHVQ